MPIQSQRGTEDVLPANAFAWQRLESAFMSQARLWGYKEIRTPTFEATELFARNLGETSDIVTKQMYNFQDKGGRDICLKPEGTAGAMRAVIQHGLCPPGTILRLAYITNFFRYEKPQKGRLREAHQMGLELVGSPSATADAEIIEFTFRFLESIGIGGLKVSLNSIGRQTCRAAYRDALLAFAQPLLAEMSEEERAKAAGNPLRLLDSKDPKIQEAMNQAPSILDYLEPESQQRLTEIERLLTQAEIPFEVDPLIVRGLDYYTETVFEITSGDLGAQNSLCGGGRYDNLIQTLGGSPTPSVGVGIGIERVLLVLEALGQLGEDERPDVFLVASGPGTQDAALKLARQLRAAGIVTLFDSDQRSMKSQMNQANKFKARFAAILGEDELASGKISLKNLDASTQETVSMDALAQAIQNGKP